MSCIVFLLDLIKNLPQLREGQGRKAAITDESKSTNFLLSKYLPKVLLKCLLGASMLLFHLKISGGFLCNAKTLLASCRILT